MNYITHIVTCNHKRFYFANASEAYALSAYYMAVGLEAIVEAVTINDISVNPIKD